MIEVREAASFFSQQETAPLWGVGTHLYSQHTDLCELEGSLYILI